MGKIVKIVKIIKYLYYFLGVINEYIHLCQI